MVEEKENACQTEEGVVAGAIEYPRNEGEMRAMTKKLIWI